MTHCRRVVTDTAFSALGIGGLIAIFQTLGSLSLICGASGSGEGAHGTMWMLASFGASITLLLACPRSPLAHPYPALTGNVGSAAIGVGCQKCFAANPELAFAVAIVLAASYMSLMKAWHPPGGATAAIAVIGGKEIHDLGFIFAIYPIFLGTAWLLIVATIRNAFRNDSNKPSDEDLPLKTRF